MEAKIEILTLGELKKQLKVLEELPDVTDETKIFLDTGWDSIQELAPDAVAVAKAQKFVVHDELTNEAFAGYALEEKAEKMKADEATETVIVIKNLY